MIRALKIAGIAIVVIIMLSWAIASSIAYIHVSA